MFTIPRCYSRWNHCRRSQNLIILRYTQFKLNLACNKALSQISVLGSVVEPSSTFDDFDYEIKFKIFEEFYITHPTYPKSGSFCALVKSQIDGEICEHNFTLPNKQKTIDQDLYKFVVTYTRDNIVKMKFFFRDPYYTSIAKDVTVTITSFIGNTGGLLGLCTGMSLVSVFEILYYLAKVLVNIRKKEQ